MRVAFMPLGTDAWFGGQLLPSLELLKVADAKGIDAVSLPDHLVVGSDLSAHPHSYGGIRDAQATRYEPMIILTMIAAMTRRLRLSTNILLAGLRPATLLAKQIATLDILSGGRTEFAVGAGWQKYEYDAQKAPFEERYALMIDTVRACRALWAGAPAGYHGKYIDFEGAYSLPLPVQRGGPPILFGIGYSDRNLERVALYADGWSPLGMSFDVVAAGMAKIKTRLKALGRDPASFRLKMQVLPVKKGGAVDRAATIALMKEVAAIGGTDIEFMPFALCQGPEDFSDFIDEVVAYRDNLNR